ncbi:MAG: Smr/MutS family protein [Rhodospirillales bacterium]
MASRGRRTPEPGEADDAALWQRLTAQVTPLKRPDSKSVVADAKPAISRVPPGGSATPSPPLRRASSVATPTRLPPAEPPRPATLAPGVAPGLDQRTLNRLKRGLIPPEATIDLHNMTQEEAHRALARFLATAQAAGRRSVLVITGKGYGSGGSIGVLKTNVPHWINETPNRERVLALTHASRSHGGEGALFVLLRRLRPR